MSRAERLLVLLPPRHALGGRAPTGSVPVAYLLLHAGAMRSGSAPLAQLPPAARVDLVLDAADVPLYAIEAPKLSDGRLRLALPGLLEDRLLTDPADAHVAFQRTGERSLDVAVVDRGWLTRVLDACAAANLRPRAAYSALHLVPGPPTGELAVFAGAQRGVVRTGALTAIGCDLAGTLPPELALAAARGGIARVRVWGPGTAELARHASALSAALEPAGADCDRNALAGALDLLQGPFDRGGLLGGPVTRAARQRAGSLAIWSLAIGAVFLAGMNAYWLKLESEAQALRTQAVAAFRGNFPSFAAVPDDAGLLARLATQELDKLRRAAGLAAPSDFAALQAQAAQLLAGAPAGALAGLDYRDGTLSARFKPGQAPDANLQANLRARAAQQGLSARFEPADTLVLTVQGS